MVVLDAGRVAAAGPTAQILPRLELLPEEERGEGGAVLDMQVIGRDEVFGMLTLVSPAGEIHVVGLAAASGTTVRVRVRARDVIIATERPRGLSALNILPGRIAEVRSGNGHFADVLIDCNGEAVTARITRQSAAMLGLAPGLPVFAVVKSVTFDAANTAQAVAGGLSRETTTANEVG
jgi:molybdate transport system ATP-binding protein